jgi:hypothetical protein
MHANEYLLFNMLILNKFINYKVFGFVVVCCKKKLSCLVNAISCLYMLHFAIFLSGECYMNGAVHIPFAFKNTIRRGLRW